MTKEKLNDSFASLKDTLGIGNVMAAPRLTKVVVSVGTGKRAKIDRQWNDFVAEQLKKVTGQKPAPRGAKKSIAGFKIRQGDPIGQVVTLRGKAMNGFVDKLIHIALPRAKDFRGISRTGIDKMGNLTMGIKEHTIFPETSDEELRNVFGMSITLVSTAKDKQEATSFFEYLGVPFKKEE